MRTRALGVCAALAAALALPAAAQADSILYVKDGNVHLSTPDGARQYQVTKSGGYSYASQADDGTIIALAPGERLHKLSRDGKVLADFPTFVSDGAPVGGPVNQFAGPFEPEISPDGTKVAFEWWGSQFSNDAGCSPASVPPCYFAHSTQGVGITSSSGFTGYEEYGLMTGWIYPSWVSNDTLLRSDSGANLTDHAVFTKVAPASGDGQLDPWFFDDTAGGLVSDVELSRDRKAIVGIAGTDEAKLRVYRPTVDPFNAPNWDHKPFAQNTRVIEPCYEYSGPVGGKFLSVSIAPDSRHIAYGVGDGIWISDLPDLSGGCASATENALKIPGGQYPDWGPAGVPTGSGGSGGGSGPAPGSNSQQPGNGGGNGNGNGNGNGGANTAGPSLGALTIACKAKCKVKATALAPKAVARSIGTKTLAKASGKRSKKGKVKLRLKASKRGATALPSLVGKKVKVTIKVTQRGKTRTITKRVKVKG